VDLASQLHGHGIGIPGNPKIRLSQDPEWDVDFNLGAAKLDADLASLRTPWVAIDAGASTVDVRVGCQRPESPVEVQAGLSSITPEVPRSAGCEVRLHTDSSINVEQY
jgi:hypothetical protein